MPARVLDDPLGIACVFSDGLGTCWAVWARWPAKSWPAT